MLKPPYKVEEITLFEGEDEDEQRSATVRKLPIYTCVFTMAIAVVPIAKNYLVDPDSIFKQTILGIGYLI